MDVTKIVAWCLWLLMGLSATAHLLAQSLNDFNNRVEGTRRIPVAAAPVIELIGLHAFCAPFRSSDNVNLNVAFYVSNDPSRIRLTAREYVRNEFYWMEAKPAAWRTGWNVFGPWPVKDSLRRHRIGSENLVILVRLDGFRTGSGVVTPVFVRQSYDAAVTTEYRAYFMAGKRLRAVRYTLLRADRTVVKEGTLGGKPALIPFTIVLPVAGLGAGPLRLALSCDVVGEVPSRADFEFDFHHQPAAPNE